jgi:hypothetical protein
MAQTVKLCSKGTMTKLAFSHNAVAVLQISTGSVSKDRLK